MPRGKSRKASIRARAKAKVKNQVKAKTKSSVKKRFKLTANGDVVAAQANKQHNMRKRSKKQLRRQRGTVVLGAVETRRVKQFMPYGNAN